MTKEDWLKKLTEEKAFTHKGSLNPNWLREHSAEEYPELLGDSLSEEAESVILIRRGNE